VRAVVVPRYGSPDVLELRTVPDPRPGRRDVLVSVEAIGVNYHDTLARTGALALRPPFVAGVEGAGTVIEVGSEVAEIEVGQRVAWPLTEGSYAELASIPAASAVPVPDGVTSELAASLVAQGLTAHYLAIDAYPVRPGDDVVVLAAAGGVGRLVLQLACYRGGRVLATTSTPEKAQAARSAGAAAALSYDGWAPQVRDLTGGKGAQVVYDGVGASTFESSLAAVARRGHIVLYGASSGPVPPFDLRRLAKFGSPYISRPSLRDYVVTRPELLARAAAVFDLAAKGVIDVPIAGRFALADAGDAQRRLEDRARAGKLLIFPGAVPPVPECETAPGVATRV